jgi:mono/diheme cytochrome c family protein/uncharacterized membrane protein YobD (UPF0266 family)
VPIFLVKSFLSIAILLSALFAMYTMFEVFGRTEGKRDINRLKRLHRANGVFFVALYAVIAYFCLDYLLRTKAEPSPRAALHGVLALSVILLLAVKVAYVRVYRAYYNHAKTLGLLVALLALGMVATSAGYYLLVTRFGTEPPGREAKPLEAVAPAVPERIVVRTDAGSIEAGKALYMEKCFLCHDPYGTETVIGPGHKGILRRDRLPVSHRLATPENVARQLRNPYDKMPSFSYLTEEQVEELIAFLNTL